MPVRLLVTVPLPAPTLVTDKTCCTTLCVKLAVAVCPLLTVTTHGPVPLHGPVQPVKVDPRAGVAVRVTIVPAVYGAAQVVPQLMPARLLVTVPVPVPSLPTDNGYCTGSSVKLAVAARAA